jgi:hypothetical protein
MGVQSIRIETLGDLAGRGYGLNALCEAAAIVPTWIWRPAYRRRRGVRYD